MSVWILFIGDVNGLADFVRGVFATRDSAIVYLEKDGWKKSAKAGLNRWLLDSEVARLEKHEVKQ